MYDSIKQASGPTKKSTGEIIQDHPRSGDADGTLGAALFRVILQRECSNKTIALNAIKCLPWLKELDSDPPLKN